MSYILEALKKSERDRALGQVPSLSAEQVTVRDPRPVARWGLAAVMVLIGLSGGILLARLETGTSRHHPTKVAAPTAVVQQRARPQAGAASPSPAHSSPAGAAAPTPSHGDAAPHDASPPHPASARARPAAAAVPPPAVSANDSSAVPHSTPPSPSSANAVDAPGNPPPASASHAGPMEGGTGPAAAPGAGGAVQTGSTASDSQASPASAQVPLLQDLPANVRHGLPSLHVDVHVYDSNPARRFVLINMHRYRQGDTLKAGPRLLRITRSGVVLQYHGVRFRLDAD